MARKKNATFTGVMENAACARCGHMKAEHTEACYHYNGPHDQCSCMNFVPNTKPSIFEEIEASERLTPGSRMKNPTEQMPHWAHSGNSYTDDIFDEELFSEDDKMFPNSKLSNQELLFEINRLQKVIKDREVDLSIIYKQLAALSNSNLVQANQILKDNLQSTMITNDKLIKEQLEKNSELMTLTKRLNDALIEIQSKSEKISKLEKHFNTTKVDTESGDATVTIGGTRKINI